MAAIAAAASLVVYSPSSLPPKSLLFSGCLHANPNSPMSELRPLHFHARQKLRQRVVATAKSDNGNGEDPPVPSWAQPGTDELPPWARQEGTAGDSSSGPVVPFYVYLLASTVVAIAAVGSIFEYVNQRPVFGVLNSDSMFYAPLLGFFVVIGFPSSVFLWFKSVQVANKEAEEQDRRDGYL